MASILALVAFLLIQVFAARGAFASETGSVGGTVATPDLTSVKTVLTNEAGGFVFANVPPGTYYVVFTAKLFQRVVSAPFPVVANQQVNLAVVMQLTNKSAITTLGRIVRGNIASVGAAPVIRISNQSMVSSGDLNIATAIDKLPGVEVDYGFAGQMPGSFQYLSIRGAGASGNSYENVVLEDGEPIRAGGYGVDLSGITPALYSDVELVKGLAAGSLHGADSVGGRHGLSTFAG